MSENQESNAVPAVVSEAVKQFEANDKALAEKAAPTLEESLEETRKIAEFRHKQLTALTKINIQQFCQMMMATNGVSYNDKLQAANALTEAVSFALDFGLGITKANIREKGKLAKEVNGLAGILVQTFDNRMLLIADNMKKHEDNKNATVEDTENKEQANG